MLWACHLCGIFVPTNWDYGYDGGESGFHYCVVYCDCACFGIVFTQKGDREDMDRSRGSSGGDVYALHQ